MINFYLPGAQKGEKIIMLLRRHWFVMFGKLMFWVVVAVLPIALYLFSKDIIDNFFVDTSLKPIFVLFVSIYYLYIWLFILQSFVDYYLDVWIISNKRIINIEQVGLFHRDVSEQRLFRVQDVTYELEGFFSTIINYGTLYIQTAGEQERFVFKQVPQPQNVVRKINEIIEREKKYFKVMESEDEIRTRKK